MRKVLLLTAFLLGVAFDILFWQKTPGISFAVYVSLCLVGGYLLLRSQNIRPAKMSLVLLGPILFCAVMTFNRQEPLTLLLNYAFTLFCMALLVMTYRSGRWHAFGFMDYLANSIRLIFSMVSSGWSHITHQDSGQYPHAENKKPNPIWPIVRGIVIALPILFVFGALFSSADLIFASRVDNLLAFLSLQNLGEYIFRGVYVLLIAYVLIGVFTHAANHSLNENLTGKDKPFLAPFLGFTEAAIILGSILLLFSAFVLVQFQYFFSGLANISLEGFTYSEYARRGFGELVAVAALNLFLFQSLSVITKRNTPGQKRTFSGLGIGLVALVIVILISSFQRLYLYEAAYGFTRSRAYAHVFIIWLGVLLLTVVALEVLNRQRSLAAAALMILAGFIASLSILNVDQFIARQNIHSAISGRELDTAYLASLSSDAVPALVNNYSTANLSLETKNNVEAVLACFDIRQKASAPEYRSWQSFHFSNWKAARKLNTVQDNFKKYFIEKDTYQRVIVAPDGMELTCPGY